MHVNFFGKCLEKLIFDYFVKGIQNQVPKKVEC